MIAPFDLEIDAFALMVAGFDYEHVSAEVEDRGGPESGPDVHFNPATDIWTSPVMLTPTRMPIVFAVYVSEGEADTELQPFIE